MQKKNSTKLENIQFVARNFLQYVVACVYRRFWEKINFLLEKKIEKTKKDFFLIKLLKQKISTSLEQK